MRIFYLFCNKMWEILVSSTAVGLSGSQVMNDCLHKTCWISMVHFDIWICKKDNELLLYLSAFSVLLWTYLLRGLWYTILSNLCSKEYLDNWSTNSSWNRSFYSPEKIPRNANLLHIMKLMMILIISYITYFIYPSYLNSWVSCMCVHSLRTWTTYQSKFLLKKYWTFFWMKHNFHWIQWIQRKTARNSRIMEAWIDVLLKILCATCVGYVVKSQIHIIFFHKK